jgi:hypothetical protein
MLSLLVYMFDDRYYLVFLGGSSGFKTKEDIFRTGKEKEIFTIIHLPNTSFVETLRQFVAEADKRGIKDIHTTDTIFADHQLQDKRSSGSVN